MRAGFLIAIVGVVELLSSRAVADPIEPEDVHAPREIVIATVKDKLEARREILQAASQLGYAVAWETAFEVPRQRRHVGPVIAARSGAAGQIVVSSYLGDADDISGALHDARRFFPHARTVAVTLPEDATDVTDVSYAPAGVLIVSSHRSYASALRAARAFSHDAGIAYDSRRLIFDEKRGLIWPDDDDDDIYAGQYAPRRYDECNDGGGCVSVERSDGYVGFEPGLFIVVAGIVYDQAESAARLAAARRHAPDAHVDPTILYMGCMH